MTRNTLFGLGLLGLSGALVVCAILWCLLVGPSQKASLIIVPLMMFSLGIQAGLCPWFIERQWTLLERERDDS